MKSVIIYMSTFNGEKYIREQLDSILRQKDVSVSIMIRDDGSSDGTKKILDEYSQKNSNIDVEFATNLGYSNSFLTLLKDTRRADYYAFADQDDVWMDDKLSRAISVLGDNDCSVYASPLLVVDEALKPVGLKTFPGFTATIGSALSRNRLAGCTMVFGDKLKEILLNNVLDIISINKFKYGHDGWLLLFSLMNEGTIILDTESHIYYRRHGDTVTNVSGGLLKRLKNEGRHYFSKSNWRQDMSLFLLTRVHPNTNIGSFLELVATYRNSLMGRVKLLFSREINTGIVIVDLLNKLSVLVGRY